MPSSLPPAASDITVKAAFLEGVRHGLAVPSIVVFSTMLGFGSLAQATGLDAFEALLATALIWAMPAQVAMADLYAAGADLVVLLLAVSMASIRFFPMATILVGVFRPEAPGLARRLALAHLMSATTWPMAMAATHRMSLKAALAYYWPVATLCITAGCLGTLAGFWLSADMPREIRLTLVFLNSIFLAVLFAINRDRLVLAAVGCGAVLGPPIHLIEPDYGVILAGLVGGTTAFFVLGRRS